MDNPTRKKKIRVLTTGVEPKTFYSDALPLSYRRIAWVKAIKLVHVTTFYIVLGLQTSFYYPWRMIPW